MIKSIAAMLVVAMSIAVAAVPAVAGTDAAAVNGKTEAVWTRYALMRPGKEGAMTRPAVPAVPAAACAMECCCQVYDGASMTHQCKSRDDCINAGGICRPKTDAKCN